MTNKKLFSLSLSLVDENLKKESNKTHLLSPFFQAALMETLSKKYANFLHEQKINPYSQYIQFHSGSELNWIINVIDKADNEIIKKVTSDSFNEIKLKHNDFKYKINEKTLSSIGVKEFTNKYFYTDFDTNKYTIDLLTPTSFKQNDKYVFMPDIFLILQSLQVKYSTLVDEKFEFNSDMLDEFYKKAYITSYNVNSRYMTIHDVKIPAFVGSISFIVKGNQTLRNYINLLLNFGCYAGVGIKTGMGMGALKFAKEDK